MIKWGHTLEKQVTPNGNLSVSSPYRAQSNMNFLAVDLAGSGAGGSL